MNSSKDSTVILARVSSKSQEDEGYSLDSQLKLLQGYCQQNGLRVVKIYKIAETASKEQSRKIFSELLSYLHSNGVYNLAVEKTDRLTRNLKDAVAVDDWLNDDPDRMLHAVKENLKVHKEARSDVKFMWNIHLAVAKKYTDNLREEAMKGWAEKLAQGHMPSRPPAGYMTAIKNGKRIHIPDPKDAPIIKKAFELYLEPAESTVTVWAFLKQAGITTYTGRPLTKSSVHLLLKNTYYMGIITFNGGTYPGAHEPIISNALYKAVQTKMHSGRPSKQRKHNVVLRNVLTCGHCGKVITWQRQKGHLYGTCQRDLAECKTEKMLREEIVQEEVEERMKALMTPDKPLLDWLIRTLKQEFVDSTESTENYVESIQAKIKKLQRMEDMLYDDKLAGDITIERYESKKADIKRRIEELSDELLVADTTVESKHHEAIDLIELTQDAYDQYLGSELENDQKRNILTKLFDSVVYENNSVSVKYSYFAESVAQKSNESRKILGGQNMLNQTNKNDLINRGQTVENFENSPLFPIWQGHEESNLDRWFWRPVY